MVTTISEGACVGEYACEGFAMGNKLSIGSNSCSANNACVGIGNRATSFELTIGSNSCTGEFLLILERITT